MLRPGAQFSCSSKFSESPHGSAIVEKRNAATTTAPASAGSFPQGKVYLQGMFPWRMTMRIMWKWRSGLRRRSANISYANISCANISCTDKHAAESSGLPIAFRVTTTASAANSDVAQADDKKFLRAAARRNTRRNRIMDKQLRLPS